MARMIPAAVLERTESRVESMFFPIPRDGLDDGFTICHSFDLLTRNREDKFMFRRSEQDVSSW